MELIFSQQGYEDHPHHLDNPANIVRIKRFRDLTKSEKKLIKAKALRIWVEQNKHVHILNYLYYKFKDRHIIKMIEERLGLSPYK